MILLSLFATIYFFVRFSKYNESSVPKDSYKSTHYSSRLHLKDTAYQRSLDTFIQNISIVSLHAHRYVPTISLRSSLHSTSPVYLHARNIENSSIPLHPSRHIYFSQNMSHPNTMIILDSGATYAITPHLEDFIPGSYVSINSSVRSLTSTTPLIGRGTIR